MATAQRRPAVLTGSEQAALLRQPNQKAPTGLRNLCMLMLMLKAGLRPGEVLNLKAENIDWEKGKIHITKSGAARERTLWLDEELMGLLQKWRDLGKGGGTRFFTTLGGEPIKDRYLREMVKRLARKAGIVKDVHPHLLRSTFAVNLIKETNDIRLAQHALGHRDVSTTQAYVKHLFAEHSMTYYDILGYRRSGIPAGDWTGEMIPEGDENTAGPEEGNRERTREEIEGRKGRKGRREEDMAGKPDRNRHKEEINREQNKEEQINKEEANKEVNEDKKRSPGNPEQKSDNAKSPGEKSNPEKENESDPEDVEKPQPRIDMAPDNNSGPKKPIPALKCSQCAYILRYQEDCPRCGVSFSTILAHWRRNV